MRPGRVIPVAVNLHRPTANFAVFLVPSAFLAVVGNIAPVLMDVERTMAILTGFF
jgi:hypothetical protein